MKTTMIALILSALTLAACGRDDGTEAASTTTTSAPTPITTITESEPATAYDEEILTQVEDEIKQQMHEIARDNEGTEEDLVSHCIADGDRNFTCESSLLLGFTDPELPGVKFCTSIEATQRGNVSPNGDYTWKNTGTNEDEEPYEC